MARVRMMVVPMVVAALLAGCGSSIRPDPANIARLSAPDARDTLKQLLSGQTLCTSVSATMGLPQGSSKISALQFPTAEAFRIDRGDKGAVSIRYQDLLEPVLQHQMGGNYWINLTTGQNIFFWGGALGMSKDNMIRVTEALAVLIAARPAERVDGSPGQPTSAMTSPTGERRDPNAPLLNIAVAGFTADGLSRSDAEVITNMLRGELINTRAFQIVEKKNQDKLLAEQAFQQTGCTTQECAVKLGHLLNVQRMLVGSCGKLLGKYFVTVRVIDVETGKATYADQGSGTSVEDIERVVRDIAGRMALQRI